jgi:restriction system protein
MQKFKIAESDRLAKLKQLCSKYEKAKEECFVKTSQRNAEVDELERQYREAVPSAVITYNSMVLERSEYPDGFPQFSESRMWLNPKSWSLSMSCLP